MTRIANATADPEEHGEIEVTPEMIEAGVDILYGFQTVTCPEEIWAERIYRAMFKAAVARKS